MSNKITKKTLATAVGGAFIAGMAISPIAGAAENPFSMNELSSGYMQVASEGNCGGMKDAKKAKEGKCGGDMKEAKKAKEGQCGEGKCGGDKKEAKSSMEGNCGGDKKKMSKEGNCGGSK